MTGPEQHGAAQLVNLMSITMFWLVVFLSCCSGGSLQACRLGDIGYNRQSLLPQCVVANDAFRLQVLAICREQRSEHVIGFLGETLLA